MIAAIDASFFHPLLETRIFLMKIIAILLSTEKRKKEKKKKVRKGITRTGTRVFLAFV